MESTCADCGKVLYSKAITFRQYQMRPTDPDQIPLFNWRYWEEDTRKEREHPDKLDIRHPDEVELSVKYVCPACAVICRNDIEAQRKLQATLHMTLWLAFLVAILSSFW